MSWCSGEVGKRRERGVFLGEGGEGLNGYQRGGRITYP